jgi:hypothetical protein
MEELSCTPSDTEAAFGGRGGWIEGTARRLAVRSVKSGVLGNMAKRDPWRFSNESRIVYNGSERATSQWDDPESPHLQ